VHILTPPRERPVLQKIVPQKKRLGYRIARSVGFYDAFAEDFVEAKWFDATVYDYTKDQRKEAEALLAE